MTTQGPRHTEIKKEKNYTIRGGKINNFDGHRVHHARMTTQGPRYTEIKRKKEKLVHKKGGKDP